MLRNLRTFEFFQLFIAATYSTHVSNTSCYPLFLNPERDETIFRLTEGRVPCVNHEVVPDYFRTKPDPAVEALEKEMEGAAPSNADSQQQANKLNSVCDKLLEKVQCKIS